MHIILQGTKEKMLREKDGDMCGRHELSETGEGKGGESETGEERVRQEREREERVRQEREREERVRQERVKEERERKERVRQEREREERVKEESETGEKKGRKQQQQRLFQSPVRIYVPCVVSSTGRIATSKKIKEGSIISISDHGGCAPTLENNSGPDIGI